MDNQTQNKFEKTAEALKSLQQQIDRIDKNIKQLSFKVDKFWEIQLEFMSIFRKK